MASGLPSSGNELFPPALRVLAVDDEFDSLIALEKMLLQCSYQVTNCQHAEDALSLLRENNSLFDILLTEIQMPEMNGFQLLAETLKLPINLPVIFFSAYLDQDKAKEGINAGASFVLSKPISMDILKVIWQLAYSFPKRFDLGRGGSVALVVPNKGIEEERDDNLSCGSKKKSYQNNSNITVPAIEKTKPIFLWTKERKNLFVEAVEFLGVDKCVPKKILEYMQRRQKDSYLTRYVISSYLQKYRGKIAAKQGASYDKKNSSKAPYSRDANQHTSTEIPPMGYTETPSPCSIQMPTTSNITPEVSSSQSSYLDQGSSSMYRECCQMNENKPNQEWNLNVPPPSYELQQNAVGSGSSTKAVPQPNQHLSFPDSVNQDL